MEERCISRKEYLKKYDSNVGYALFVQDNIRKDDYARLNTGEIVKVIGIRENNINKKAIYYGIYETDWFDSSVVENFSDNIIDLIEEGDYINGELVTGFGYEDVNGAKEKSILVEGKYTKVSFALLEWDIKSILTHEQFEKNSYKV